MSAARSKNIKRGWGDDLAPIPVTKIDAELYGALRNIEGDQLIMRDNQIQVGAFTLTTVGLEMTGENSKEEWDKIGEMLFRLEGSIQWLIGDWLVYGEGVHYGELKDFADKLEMDYGTLRNYASVARNVNLSLRNDKLSYHHHVAVSKLNPEWQKFALEYAASQKKMPVAKFRQWIAEQTGQASTPALSSGEDTAIKPVSDQFKRLLKRDRREAEEYLVQIATWAASQLSELRGGKK